MLDFGKLEIVEKTFTREPGAVRGQAYHGIKFRRFESNKGKKAAEAEGKPFTPEIEEQFVISNKAWNDLGLETNALTEFTYDKQTFLVVVPDQDGGEVPAKFCRRSINKDNSVAKKGKMFSNEFLTADLVKGGVLKAEILANQYLKLTDAKKELSNIPASVIGVYLLEVDEAVKAGEDEEEGVAETANSDKF